MNVREAAYMFACFRETGSDQARFVRGRGRERRLRHVFRFEKRSWSGGSGAFPCFSGGGIDTNASSGETASEGGSMVTRHSKVYDPSLAKRILGKKERTLYERLSETQEMPFPLSSNEDVNEEALISPRGAWDQCWFRNVPDVTMRSGHEKQRREVCSSKLQEIERELQEFLEAFGTKLLELKKSMDDCGKSLKDLMHFDEGNYIEDRLWEEADSSSKAVDIVSSSHAYDQSPPDR